MDTAELGRRLGNISGSAIWTNRKRIEEAIKDDRCLSQLMQKIEELLKKENELIVKV